MQNKYDHTVFLGAQMMVLKHAIQYRLKFYDYMVFIGNTKNIERFQSYSLFSILGIIDCSDLCQTRPPSSVFKIKQDHNAKTPHNASPKAHAYAQAQAAFPAFAASSLNPPINASQASISPASILSTLLPKFPNSFVQASIDG